MYTHRYCYSIDWILFSCLLSYLPHEEFKVSSFVCAPIHTLEVKSCHSVPTGISYMEQESYLYKR